mmetsp:Transcript_43176/g.104185  ORF Transcript_43176/g.104185 Transcript_43176/m.104185 type:complete len:215 (+) Transcript_43176:2348-2992(+)
MRYSTSKLIRSTEMPSNTTDVLEKDKGFGAHIIGVAQPMPCTLLGTSASAHAAGSSAATSFIRWRSGVVASYKSLAVGKFTPISVKAKDPTGARSGCILVMRSPVVPAIQVPDGSDSLPSSTGQVRSRCKWHSPLEVRYLQLLHPIAILSMHNCLQWQADGTTGSMVISSARICRSGSPQMLTNRATDEHDSDNEVSQAASPLSDERVYPGTVL